MLIPPLLREDRIFYFLRFYLCILERGQGREKERERNIIVWLPLARLQPETQPTTSAHALPRNRTGNLSVCKKMPSPLSTPVRGGVQNLEDNDKGDNPEDKKCV